jgi:hypothetical protein
MIQPNFSTEVAMLVYTTLFSISLFIACSCLDPSDDVMITHVNNGRKINASAEIIYDEMYYC